MPPSQPEAQRPYCSHVMNFRRWDDLQGLHRRPFSLPERRRHPGQSGRGSSEAVFIHRSVCPRIEGQSPPGTGPQGEAPAYTEPRSCPGICSNVPEPRPQSPPPGSFGKISSCVQAKAETLSDSGLQSEGQEEQRERPWALSDFLFNSSRFIRVFQQTETTSCMVTFCLCTTKLSTRCVCRGLVLISLLSFSNIRQTFRCYPVLHSH